jgi:hypothetical protein
MRSGDDLCGLDEWLDAPLSLALHSQTDHFAGRNQPLRLVR